MSIRRNFVLSLFFSLGFSVIWSAIVLTAQETPIQPPVTQPPRPVMEGPGVPAPRMNPAVLLKMREQAAFELREIQRTLGFIDPADTQIAETLKERQTELTEQLKDATAQLKAQGFPIDEPAASGPSSVGSETALPVIPKAQDPTLVPGGVPQRAVDPNLLIQRVPLDPRSGGFQQPGGMFPGTQIIAPKLPPENLGTVPGSVPGTYGVPQMPPTAFDQDQAWANSPWTPQPSKELTELKQTVDSLRKELGEMKETVKALEAQIRLLNQNILLSQPTAKPAN